MIVTLEQELQELVERMLDDSDLASFADVVSRSKTKIERQRAQHDEDQLLMRTALSGIELLRADNERLRLSRAEVSERLRAEIEQLQAALKKMIKVYAPWTLTNESAAVTGEQHIAAMEAHRILMKEHKDA
jgi:hypothetical protein